MTVRKLASSLVRWSGDPRRRDVVLLLHADGMTSTDIASRIGASVSSVCRFIVKQGLESRGVVPPISESHDDIISLHRAGYSNRRIARSLGRGATAVSRAIKILGLSSLRGRPRKIKMVTSTEALCQDCGEVKSVASWPSKSSASGGRYLLPICAACVSHKLLVRANVNVTSQMRIKLNLLRSRCKRNGIPFDIKLDYLLALWEQQLGCCAYTGVALKLERGEGKRHDSASFDRFSPDGGYIEGNVILVSFRANAIKHDMTMAEFQEWMPGWFVRGSGVIRSIRPTGNVLDGYTPSYAMNRVLDKSLG